MAMRNQNVSSSITHTTDISSVRCPVCESLKHYERAMRLGLSVRKCRECGLHFVSPYTEVLRLESEGAASSPTDDGYIERMINNAEERGKLSIAYAEKRLSIYRSILAREPEKIYEIGAGDGAYDVGYSYWGVEYLGVDINRQIVEKANALGRKVLYGTISALNSYGKCDVVFLSQVLEHVLEPNPLIKDISNIMKDDGILHIDVPNDKALTSSIRKLGKRDKEFGFIQLPHHQIAYSKSALELLLRKNAFSPLFIEAKGNFDQVWGQLITKPRLCSRVILDISGIIGMGSLLVTIARKTDS